MKKRIITIVLCLVMMFSLTACDSPAEMMHIYKESKDKAGNTLDALGIYFKVYGWYHLMNEDSDADISWDEAAKKSEILRKMPKLTDTIDVVEYNRSSSAVIHLTDEDYEKSIENYVKLLKDYGYSFISDRSDKNKYELKFYMETEDEPIAIIIKGYELKYKKTKNVYIYINKSKYNNPF
ncbi:MAG: hypothetical protein K5796_11585 [Lachnospiraceae bacterium]|nr:hypothetical protein [Lachnospiraceae bacterium]